MSKYGQYMLELIDTGQPYQPTNYWATLCTIEEFRDNSITKGTPPNVIKIPNYDLWVCAIDEPNHCYYSLVFYPKKYTEGKDIKIIYWDSVTGFIPFDWIHGKLGLYEFIIKTYMDLHFAVFDEFWGIEGWEDWVKLIDSTSTEIPKYILEL